MRTFNGSQINNALPARHIVIAGSTGSGKSTYLKKHILPDALKRVPRLLVFDPKNEYDGDRFFKGCKITARSSGELAAQLKPLIDKPFTARFIGTTKADFEAWAQIVFAMGSCICVAEELAAFTSPAKAPPSWHRLISQGRAKGKYGIQIAALTQSPAESDKTIVRNASIIHTGRLSRAGDRRYMADEMDCDLSKIEGLQDLEFVQKNQKTHQFTEGKIKI